MKTKQKAEGKESKQKSRERDRFTSMFFYPISLRSRLVGLALLAGFAEVWCSFLASTLSGQIGERLA